MTVRSQRHSKNAINHSWINQAPEWLGSIKRQSGFERFCDCSNGVPDILDEMKWELDWLQGMQDPADGGAYCIVKPNGTIDGWYQSGMPDEAHNDDRILLPKDTTCTGMLAGALATAAASPAMQRYFPAETERWRAQAEQAWRFLQANADKPALCYQAYGCAVTTGPNSGCNKSAADLDMSRKSTAIDLCL